MWLYSCEISDSDDKADGGILCVLTYRCEWLNFSLCCVVCVRLCVWAGLAATLDPLPSLLIRRCRRFVGPRFCGASSGSRCLSSCSCCCWWSLPSCCQCLRRTTALSPTTLLIPYTRCSATLTDHLQCRLALGVFHFSILASVWPNLASRWYPLNGVQSWWEQKLIIVIHLYCRNTAAIYSLNLCV